MVFLQSYSISPKQCMRIYQRYGHNSIGIVKKNPYVLCEEVQGFGFKTADNIAMNLGIEKNSEYRIKSGIKYIINNYATIGNTCIDLDLLIDETVKTLNIEDELVLNCIKNLIIDEELISEKMNDRYFIFLPNFYYYENNSAQKIVEIVSYKNKNIKIDVDDFIKTFEHQNGIKFHENQIEAIKSVKSSGFEIITGGPGTGKTTIIKCILKLLQEAKMTVLMAAPTGRAAKRMTETTGYESKTIHRLLDIVVDDDEENSNDINETDSGFLDCDCIIIDEASMIDIMLLNNLLKCIKVGTKVILVGDVDQLPSVGAGRVLEDLIESNYVKVVRLNHIYRQGNESMITVNAHRINNGEYPMQNKKDADFFIMDSKNQQNTKELVVDLITKRLPSWQKDWNPKSDMQILTPMRKGELGVDNLNEVMKEHLNHNSTKYSFTKFSVGDKVMQTKNNYSLKSRRELDKNDFTFEEETGVFNGDIGYVAKINDEDQLVTVIFDDERYVDYSVLELDELDLAYAITIHKSQGSEFKVVVIPLYMGPPLLMNRNLIYTAVTRAKKLIVLVGDTKALYMMIKNKKTQERYSSLGYKLKMLKDSQSI